jgi:hypothetical protein
VQSFSTTAAGSDTFAGAGDSGGSLSLANGAESYTIDEFQTNSGQTDTTETGSGTSDISLNASSSDGSGYSLSIEVTGSLSEAGTDSVVSSAAEIDYSSDGGGNWDYSAAGNGDTSHGRGDDTAGYDLDVYGSLLLRHGRRRRHPQLRCRLVRRFERQRHCQWRLDRPGRHLVLRLV